MWPNRDVKTFYTSNQERNRGREGYIWKIVGFTPCSSPCAGGKGACTRVGGGINKKLTNQH